MKKFVDLAFGNPVAIAFMVVGAVLLALAVHFGVNPADGSVVDASVRETWIPVFLFLATAPAMAIMFVSGGGVIGLPLMYLAQIIVYWAAGRGVACLISHVAPSRRSGRLE